MIAKRIGASAILLAVSLSCACAAHAEGAGERHQAWHACLTDAFALRAALSGKDLAAETALRECRASETAYLDALSTSPLLDEDDVARARPALVARAKTWLLSGQPSRNL